MGVGKSLIVDLPRDAAEIFVGNPKVANAIVRSARKLYVIGLDKGQTTVFALDAARPPDRGRCRSTSAGTSANCSRSCTRRCQLRTSSPGRSTTRSSFRGEVEFAEEAKRATTSRKVSPRISTAPTAQSTGMVVNSLTIRGRDQVMLKVTVAEIDRNVAKQLGLTSSTWGPFTQYNPFGINGNIATSASGQTTGITLSNPSSTVIATLQAFERYGVSQCSPSRQFRPSPARPPISRSAASFRSPAPPIS